MTTSRVLRLMAGGAALIAAACAAWLVGGNAVAARRERAAASEWEKAFGSYQALVRKYTLAESNASARRVEEISREIGFDLSPRSGGIRARGPLSDAGEMLCARISTKSSGAPAARR